MTDRKQLCDECYSLFFKQPPGGSNEHHLSGPELKACAESRSCSLCANLWSRCSDTQQAGLCKGLPSSEATSNNGGGEGSSLKCYYENGLLRFTLPVTSETDVELPLRPAPMGFETTIDMARKRVDDKTFTETTSKLAKQWIDNCLSWHAHSKLTRTSDPRPTRLIEVGTVKEPRVRVRETMSDSPEVDYVALSHRWINGKILRLLKDNIEAYREAIPSELMSNNFNDAVAVTRMLGVGYVWIDSLCIIQDSEADWATEATRMADYYEYSYCTLSATASTEHDQGLIIDRDPNVVLPTFYDLRRPVEPDQKTKPIFKRLVDLSISAVRTQPQPENHLLPVGQYVLLDPRPWHREVDASPLNTRAWCYQERLLSSRTLHFCKTRIFFECLESKCSEDAIHGIPKDIFVQDLKGCSPQARLLTLKKHDRSDFARYAHAMWASTVSQYSSRDLTFAKDRLVALSSVAKRFREFMSLGKRDDAALKRIECHRQGQKRPDYFLGIWLCASHAVHGLCWVTSGGRLQNRPEQLVGLVPTWSFGSVTSQVSFALYDTPVDATTELARIVKIDADFQAERGPGLELGTAMWTGLISPGSGAIWLEGSLLPIRLSCDVLDQAEASEDPARFLTEAGTWEDHPVLIVGDAVQRWGWTADALRDKHGWSGQYFVMGLCAVSKEKRLHGIVLEWVDDSFGCFRRVGSFCWGPPGDDDGLDLFTAHLDHDGLDARFYEARADGNKLRIKIV